MQLLGGQPLQRVIERQRVPQLLGTVLGQLRDGRARVVPVVRSILVEVGGRARIYRNTLLFLAPDQSRLQDLDEAVRRHLAWDSILAERELLNLSPHQVRQAETQRDAAAEAVTARLPETYQWLLTPVQAAPADPVSWEATRLTGHDELATRAGHRLKSDDLLAVNLAGTRLRMALDRVPLWRGDHVEIRQLVEDFARYPYLPRLQGPTVLLRAAADGVGLLTWANGTFGYTDSFDEQTRRYRGLRGGQVIELRDVDLAGLLVKPDVARRQIDAERAEPAPEPRPVDDAKDTNGGEPTPDQDLRPPADPRPRRFHGTVALDATRTVRDASRVADEVITQLAGLVGANVTVTLEIDAQIPNGAPDHVVRAVTENSRTLKFSSHGFERE